MTSRPNVPVTFPSASSTIRPAACRVPHEGDMLEAEPGKWVRSKTKRVKADADNVTMLGVEIGCVAPAGRRKTMVRERGRDRLGF